MTDLEKLAVAEAYRKATAAGDGTALRDLHEADAVTWHNTDGADASLERTVRTLLWLHKTVPDLGFADVRADPTPDGFVLRWTMTGSAPGGPLNLPSCLIVELSPAGKIARVSEYLDSAHVGVLSS